MSCTRKTLLATGFATASFAGPLALADERGGDTTGAGSEVFSLAERIDDKVESDAAVDVYVSYHGLSDGVARALSEGVERRSRATGVNANVIGPVSFDPERQVEQIESLLDRMDALAVSSAHAPVTAPLIDRAIGQGIPVVTFGSDAPESRRLAFVGQDLAESGRVAARWLARALGEEGRVLVTTVDAHAHWSIERERGAREVLDRYEGIEIAAVVETGTEPTEITDAVDAAMRAHEGVDGVIALGCCSTPAVGRWVRRHDLTGTTHVIGFDLLGETVELVAEGAIDAAIDESPGRQGFEAVDVLARFLDGKPIRDVDTGVTLYTTEDVYDGF